MKFVMVNTFILYTTTALCLLRVIPRYLFRFSNIF